MRWWIVWVWIGIASVLGLLAVIFFIHLTPTTTTTYCAPKTCLVYGDPHINTFDGEHANYYTAGEYWIVRSATVSIQGQYAATAATNGLAVTKKIAIGGPFL